MFSGGVLIGIILLIIVAIVIFWFSNYNQLVRMRNWVQEAFSQIDVQLQQRNDLIPNLVETVKGYAKHESGTLEAVTQARQQLIELSSATDPQLVNELSNQLTGALSRLIAVAEQYPDLKANTNFTQLQTSLESIEQRIASARQLYNSAVTQYNNKVQTVPSNLVANVHGFQTKATLEAPKEAREVPQVHF